MSVKIYDDPITKCENSRQQKKIEAAPSNCETTQSLPETDSRQDFPLFLILRLLLKFMMIPRHSVKIPAQHKKSVAVLPIQKPLKAQPRIQEQLKILSETCFR